MLSRSLKQAFVTCVLLVSLTSLAHAQGTPVLVPGPWPWTTACFGPPSYDAFHILYDPSALPGCKIPDAALRLTNGVAWTDPLFGQLGVVDTLHTFQSSWNGGQWFSAIAPMNATVLRSSWGDLVLSATTSLPMPTHAGPPPHASIHFGTTPSPPATDTSAEQPWDMERMTLWWDGKAAIGTQGTVPAAIFGDSLLPGEYDLFHLHVPCLLRSYTVDPASGYSTNQLASLKLSYGGIADQNLRFAQLGFDRNHQLSSFSSNEDLVLSTNSDIAFGPAGAGLGDMIFSNRRIGKAIRFGTTYDTGETPGAITDAEHVAILSNGNVGIDMPDSATGLMMPKEQVEIGGATVAAPGNIYPTPGLTIYGGSKLENTLRPSGGYYPEDWRSIGFNGWIDHTDTGATRFHRFEPIASSGISFSQSTGGLLSFNCSPYDPTGKNHDLTLQLTGSAGMSLWFMDTTRVPYHHLLNVIIPGDTAGGVRNTNGLTYFHTPVCITSDHPGDPVINFTNLDGLHPDIGDGQTWTLVINGAALAKEIFVLDSTWADYVFDPSYKLLPLDDFGTYLRANHHLPEIPPAKEIAKTGIPVGKTEEALTRQMEEMARYIVELNTEVKDQKSEIDAMKMELKRLYKKEK